jgi:hypothetical protein
MAYGVIFPMPYDDILKPSYDSCILSSSMSSSFHSPHQTSVCLSPNLHNKYVRLCFDIPSGCSLFMPMVMVILLKLFYRQVGDEVIYLVEIPSGTEVPYINCTLSKEFLLTVLFFLVALPLCMRFVLVNRDKIEYLQ